MHKRIDRAKFSDLAVAIGIGELERASHVEGDSEVPKWLFEAAMRDELTNRQYRELVAACDSHPTLWESFIRQGTVAEPATQYSFSNFVVAPNNRLAFENARKISQFPQKRSPAYLICGESGSGKTHLLRAIAEEIRQKNPETPVFLGSAAELTSAGSLEVNDELDGRSRSGVWLIDDAQGADRKSRLATKVASLVGSGHRVVLTSDRSPLELAKVGVKFNSDWLESAEVVNIGPPDTETLSSIVKEKARNAGLTLDYGVASYLAEHLGSRMSLIEDTLAQLVTLGVDPVTLANVRKLLGTGTSREIGLG